MPAALLILASTFLSVLAQFCFKLSSTHTDLGGFVLWQALGNSSAFLGTLSYSASMRWLPLHVAFPLIQGLSVLAVTVIDARLIFQESILPVQWLGILLICIGVALIGFKPAGKGLRPAAFRPAAG